MVATPHATSSVDSIWNLGALLCASLPGGREVGPHTGSGGGCTGGEPFEAGDANPGSEQERSIDGLLEAVDHSAEQVCAALFALEVAGFIETRPGQRYRRTPR